MFKSVKKKKKKKRIIKSHALLQGHLPNPGDLPNPGIEPKYPALWADSLLSDTPEEPRNTGVGNLSLLQGIFQTQEFSALQVDSLPTAPPKKPQN